METFTKCVPILLLLAGACAAEPIARTEAAEPAEPATCPGHTGPSDEPTEPAAIPDIATFDQIVAAGGAPFDQLSPEELAELRESMTESWRGISTIRYEILERSLSPEDYADALGMFGISLGEGDTQRRKDYMDYRCSGKATCTRSPGDICIGENC